MTYLGPLELEGSVVRDEVENLFTVDNNGANLGILTVSNLFLLPRSADRPNRLALPDGSFAVTSIRRQLMQRNGVDLPNSPDLVSLQEHDDQITISGSLAKITNRMLKLPVGVRVDYGEGFIHIHELTEQRSATRSESIVARLQFAHYQMSPAGAD